MRRLWAVWGLMFALLAAGPALSAAPELEPEAAKRLEALVLTAAKLRTVGILDPTRINEFFAAPDLDTPPFDLSTPGLDDPEVGAVLWSYFFRGSQVFQGHVPAEQSMLGFYNPVVDAWLLTIWSANAPEHVPLGLVDASLVLGQTLRDGGTANSELLPLWVTSLRRASLISGMQEQAAQSSSAFEKTHAFFSAEEPVIEARADDRDIVVQRLATFRNTLLELKAISDLAATQQSIHAALQKGDAGKLAELIRQGSAEHFQALTSFPQALRDSISPLIMIKEGKSAVVLSAAPTQARFALLTHLSVQDSEVTSETAAMFDIYRELEK